MVIRGDRTASSSAGCPAHARADSATGRTSAERATHGCTGQNTYKQTEYPRRKSRSRSAPKTPSEPIDASERNTHTMGADPQVPDLGSSRRCTPSRAQ
jgi:hypothetical protein